MRKLLLLSMVIALAGLGWVSAAATAPQSTYSVEVTAIEGCSCPLFCSCYYNTEPTGGHMCRFNNAYRFAEGSHWGDVDLSGTKVWFSGDLGGEFDDGVMDWLVITHDNASSERQRAAIAEWAGIVFPVEWDSVAVRDDDLTWEVGAETAAAEMGSGMASLRLERVMPTGEQAVVLNTPYWGAQSNDGFELAKATHAFHGEEHSYSFEGRNGFIITFRNEGELGNE